MLSNDKPLIPLDSCYFLTLNTVDKIDVFTRPAYKQVIADALNYFVETQALAIYSWCLMPSHLHLIVRTKEAGAPAYFERDFKKFTTRTILKTIEVEMDFRRDWMLRHFEEYRKSLQKKERYHVWQDCSGPLRIDCKQPGMLLDRIAHVHENPVRERIVEQADAYIFSSARDYVGRPGLVRTRVVQQQGFFGSRMLSAN